jgi:hypothetical protein
VVGNLRFRRNLAGLSIACSARHTSEKLLASARIEKAAITYVFAGRLIRNVEVRGSTLVCSTNSLVSTISAIVLAVNPTLHSATRVQSLRSICRMYSLCRYGRRTRKCGGQRFEYRGSSKPLFPIIYLQELIDQPNSRLLRGRGIPLIHFYLRWKIFSAEERQRIKNFLKRTDDVDLKWTGELKIHSCFSTYIAFIAFID